VARAVDFFVIEADELSAFGKRPDEGDGGFFLGAVVVAAGADGVGREDLVVHGMRI